jgi:hypothetical protein
MTFVVWTHHAGDKAGDERKGGTAVPRRGDSRQASINDSGAEAAEPSPGHLVSNQTCIASTEIQRD